VVGAWQPSKVRYGQTTVGRHGVTPCSCLIDRPQSIQLRHQTWGTTLKKQAGVSVRGGCQMPHNNALHLTASSLRSSASGELCRSGRRASSAPHWRHYF
jgi:hypothetical protein